MRNMTRKFLFLILSAIILLGFGCRKSTVQPQLKTEFDRNIDELVGRTVESCRAKMAEIAPAAVVSHNALSGKSYTRLDELISQRLTGKLSSDREVIELSRENWFEFKESRPLSFKGHSSAHYDLMENIVVFVIDVEPQPVFDRIRVSITAKDSKLRPIPGVKGQAMLEYFKESPAAILFNTAANSNPLPAGLEENPYTSMEQLSYSLASELSYAVERGVKAGVYKASDEEIQVVLCSRNFSGGNPMFKHALIKELQQALVSMDGVTSAVSRDDFAPVFSQIDFYKRNHPIFESDNEKLKPGSVLLMAETKNTGNKNQVALRAVWRVTPLKDKDGVFIPDNSSGTYVSGFTSRAWFKGAVPEVSTPQYFEPEKEDKKSSDKGFD